MVHEVPVTRARAEFADLVNRVVYGGERVVVTRHGKPIVALVPAADLDRLHDDDQQRPPTLIRLSTEGPGTPTQEADSPTRRHLGIAAQHRPPGREASPPPR